MHRTPLLTAALTALALVAAVPPVHAAEYVPGQVVVRYDDGREAVLKDQPVKATVDHLRKDPDVAYAQPNYIARASGFVPNDPGFRLQWNLAGPFGIGMPDAWNLARASGVPGGRGVVVAVLDTGVAYQRFRRFRRAPDLAHFVRGYDFVGRDRHPNDQNGHGTHVSGTIAQSTNNRKGVAGIAYRAKIMPVRVLDSLGAGDTVAISRGIRFAARRGADIINLSLEFDSSIRASQIPNIVSALRYARSKGVVVVAAAGNQADAVVAYPGRARDVIAVAATTVRGCQADYSNSGVDVDITAPGGGADAVVPPDPADRYSPRVCNPDAPGQFIFQQTFTSSVRRFGLPRGYEGTSMAAPHVSGVAALLIGSRRLGPNPSPALVEQRLEATAKDIGPPGFDPRYGAGLLDAVAALR